MPFDLASAQPVAPQFDLASAQSMVPPQQPNLVQRAARAYGNAVAGPVEIAASMATGAVAQPVAGYVGLLAEAAKAMGLTKKEPADIVEGVENALTYRPRTPDGQAAAQTLGQIGGVIPKVGNAAGQAVSDYTGSPALGALANTGTQGLGMLLTGDAGKMAEAAGRGAMAIPGVRAAANYGSDLLPGGSSRAANRLIQQYATSQGGTPAQAASDISSHLAAQEALARAGQSGALAPGSQVGPQDLANKYGIRPTTAEVAQNPGLSQLERTLRNQPADVSAPLSDASASNQGAVQRILEGISGTPESRDALQRLRDVSADANYQNALTNPEHQVMAPGQDAASFAAELAAKERGLPNSNGQPSANDPNAPDAGLNDTGVRLQALLQRPAMQDAMANATKQALNRGVQIDQSNLIQQLHYAKMHLDGQLSSAMRAGNTADVGGLMDTKNELTGVMDALSPAYADARAEYRALSAPINTADVGEALRQRYLSGMGERGGTGTTPSAFVNTLRQPAADQFAQRVTGFPGATMEGTMGPANMADLNVAADQLARTQYAQNAGRAVGSNTGQNIVNQRSLDTIGSPNGISEDMGHAGSIALALHHPAVGIPLGMIGSGVRQAAKQKLTGMMVDPRQALAALQRQPVSRPLPGPAVGVPAAVGAVGVSNDQGYADGGPTDNPYKKSSWWDLVKQAVHEVTGDDSPQSPAQQPATPAGTTPSGSVGADFDNRVNQAVAAADHAAGGVVGYAAG